MKTSWVEWQAGFEGAHEFVLVLTLRMFDTGIARNILLGPVTHLLLPRKRGRRREGQSMNGSMLGSTNGSGELKSE